MEVAAGAMNPLLRKLGDLLVAEFTLDNRVKKGVKSLLTELEMMYVVLCKAGDDGRRRSNSTRRYGSGQARFVSSPTTWRTSWMPTWSVSTMAAMVNWAPIT